MDGRRDLRRIAIVLLGLALGAVASYAAALDFGARIAT
jgi:hypothetical protein